MSQKQFLALNKNCYSESTELLGSCNMAYMFLIFIVCSNRCDLLLYFRNWKWNQIKVETCYSLEAQLCKCQWLNWNNWRKENKTWKQNSFCKIYNQLLHCVYYNRDNIWGNIQHYSEIMCNEMTIWNSILSIHSQVHVWSMPREHRYRHDIRAYWILNAGLFLVVCCAILHSKVLQILGKLRSVANTSTKNVPKLFNRWHVWRTVWPGTCCDTLLPQAVDLNTNSVRTCIVILTYVPGKWDDHRT